MKASTIKTGVFTIGFAILLALFLNVGFSLFMERPSYPTDCQYVTPACTDKAVCEPVYNQAKCDSAMNAYEVKMQAYEFAFFIFSVIVAVAGLIAGLILSKSSIGIGFMLAGIGQLIWGAAAYWQNMNKFWRFGLLGAAIALLVWFAYKRMEK